MATCILILGTPRSGTSCVAGVVHHLGIPTGEDCLPPDDWNPVGYFQDKAFEDILHACFGFFHFPQWDEVINRPPGRFSNESTRTLKQTATAIRNLAAQRAATHEIWGVKSNRLSFFLDALALGAGDDVRIIQTFRPEAESIASWKARSQYEDDEAVKPIRYMAHAITKGMERAAVAPDLVVDYNGLIDETETWVTRIADVCGVPVTQEALTFVNAGFRRFGNG